MSMDEYKNLVPEIVLQHAYYCVQKRKMIIARHQHFSFELIYLVTGDYEYQHNALFSKLNSGEGVLIRPGDWHADFLSKNTIYIAISFVVRNISEPRCDVCLQRHIEESFLRFKDDDKSIKSILTKLLAENSRIDEFSSHLQQSHVFELFWQVLRRMPRKALSKKLIANEDSIRFQEKLQSLFLANIHKFLSLNKIASNLYLTPRTLNSRCRKILHISPVKAFIKVKMDYSMKLLAQTEMSVKEISEYLGFKNPYHFSNVFKRFFKHSPTFFRKA